MHRCCVELYQSDVLSKLVAQRSWRGVGLAEQRSHKVDKAPVTANDVTVYVHGRQWVCTVLNVEKEVAQIQGE